VGVGGTQAAPRLASSQYRGSSHKRKRPPLGPYRTPMLRVLGGSQGVRRFLIGDVHLQNYSRTSHGPGTAGIWGVRLRG